MTLTSIRRPNQNALRCIFVGGDVNLTTADKATIRSLTEELIVCGSSPERLAQARKAWSDQLQVTAPAVRGTSAYIEYEANRASREANLNGQLDASVLGRVARDVRNAESAGVAERIVSSYCEQRGLPSDLVWLAVRGYNDKLQQKAGGIPSLAEALATPLARAAGMAPTDPVGTRGHQVDYSLCPLKQIHRERELAFIDRYSPGATRNDGLTVYLPSWQPQLQGDGLIGLGIRPGNIVGVENEKEIRALFEAGCDRLGIQHYFGDVQKYLSQAAQQGKPLRHVLLDFDSQFSGVVGSAVQAIEEPGAFVLTINVQGRREPAGWRDVMKMFAAARLVPDPTDPRSYQGMDVALTRKLALEIKAGRSPVDCLTRFDEQRIEQFNASGLQTKSAREYGFIHGIRHILPPLLHPEVSQRLDVFDDAHKQFVPLVLANNAFDRLKPALEEAHRLIDGRKQLPCPERMLYDFCRFCFESVRFPTACESYYYKSESASGTTPMFSLFMHIAPAYFVDQSSKPVADFVRALGWGALTADETRVTVGNWRNYWGDWFMGTPLARQLLPLSRATTLRVKTGDRTLATAKADDVFAAISSFSFVRDTWLHDNQLAQVATKEITLPGEGHR